MAICCYWNDSVLGHVGTCTSLGSMHNMCKQSRNVYYSHLFFLVDDCDDLLLSDLLRVLYLLQRISPSILPLANITMSSLINDIDSLSVTTRATFPFIKEQALSILLEAPLDSLESLIRTGL